MRQIAALVLTLALVAAGLGGCFVVPAPPPPPGAVPAPPPFVRARPHCGWSYGPGWAGWGWYSTVPC